MPPQFSIYYAVYTEMRHLEFRRKCALRYPTSTISSPDIFNNLGCELCCPLALTDIRSQSPLTRRIHGIIMGCSRE